MSLYPVRYVSGSKRTELNIEDMATPHLANAWRKLALGNGPDQDPVRLAMAQELVARGCTLDVETGKWVFPAQEAKP